MKFTIIFKALSLLLICSLTVQSESEEYYTGVFYKVLIIDSKHREYDQRC